VHFGRNFSPGVALLMHSAASAPKIRASYDSVLLYIAQKKMV